MCPYCNKSVNFSDYCEVVSELAEVGILASTYMTIKNNLVSIGFQMDVCAFLIGT